MTFVGIRSLRWGEPIPDVEPKRYRNRDGYIRLRWLVAPNCYVEEYEHRIVAGRPHPRYHVHHLNGDPADNRPENLKVLTPEEHGALHAHDQGRDPALDGYRSRQARTKAERRIERERVLRERREMVRRLFLDEGLTTEQIGREIGLHPAGVSRILRQAGVPQQRGRRPTGPKRETIWTLAARSGGYCETCIGTRIGAHVHHRQPRQMGGTRRAEINSPANLLHLCAPCHAAIESNRELAYRQGWLVHSGSDPAQVPVTLATGTVFLLPDGTYRRERTG